MTFGLYVVTNTYIHLFSFNLGFMAHFHLTLPFDIIHSYVPNDMIHLYSDLNIEMNHFSICY